MAAKKANTKKRTTSKKKASYYPTVRGSKLGHQFAALNIRVLHVDRALSRLNRRLYRQSKYYSVKIDLDNDDANQYKVFALRDDWAVQKSYQLARRAYLDNIKEEQAMIGKDMVARWDDFRVLTGLNHQEIYPVLHDETLNPTALVGGEFEDSGVVDSSNNTKLFTWGPASASTYSILAEYDTAGNAQGSPESPLTTTPYSDLNTEVNDTTVQRLTQRGNDPPYDKDGVNGTRPWVEIATLGGTGGVQKLSTGYFCAPCGIVVIQRADGNLNWVPENLSFEVKAGDYKGVHAPSMLE